MSGCIDTNPATDGLALILHEIIDIGEGGGYLKEAAEEVVSLFRRADYDFGKWTLEKLEANRVSCRENSTYDLYRALQKIANLETSMCGDLQTAINIAKAAMKKARGEKLPNPNSRRGRGRSRRTKSDAK